MDPQNLEAGLLKGKSRTDEHEQHAPAPQNTTHQSEFFKRHGKTELQVFQTLVGIHFLDYGGGGIAGRQKPPARVMDDIFRPSKAAKARFRNRGLYDRCISQDMKNRVMYGLSNYLISILYIFQVLLAAAVTALSAYKKSHVIALTTLAAINTVVAGILAWLTGQGMPSRFRRARDQYREVVHAIEAAERMFAEIDFIDWPKGERPNPIAERERLEKLYNEARIDQESNYPDSSKSPSEEQQKDDERAMDKKLAKEKEKAQIQSKEIESLQREMNILRGQTGTAASEPELERQSYQDAQYRGL